MAGEVGRVRIIIEADDQTGKELNQVKASTQGLTGSIGAAGSTLRSHWLGVTAAVAGVVGATAGAIKLGKSLVTSASDLQETQNKVGEVFGDSADEVLQFGSTAARAIGQSTQAALENASSVGSMLNAIGLADSAAATMSITMTRLASDMGSFNNEDPTEMLMRIRAGLAGEAEPLRRFGVFLSAARVEAKAMEMGLVGLNGELTEGAKVQARYAIILEDTARQQGNFQLTSRDLANATRTLESNIADLGAKIGTALLGPMEDLVNHTNDWINTNGDEFAQDMAKAIEDLVGFTSDMITPIADVVRLYRELDTVAVGTNEDVSITGEVLRNTFGARGPRDAIIGVKNAIVDGAAALVDYETPLRSVMFGLSAYNDEADRAEGVSFGLSESIDAVSVSADAAAGAVERLTLAEMTNALSAQLAGAMSATSVEEMDAEFATAERLAAQIRGRRTDLEFLAKLVDDMSGSTFVGSGGRQMPGPVVDGEGMTAAEFIAATTEPKPIKRLAFGSGLSEEIPLEGGVTRSSPTRSASLVSRDAAPTIIVRIGDRELTDVIVEGLTEAERQGRTK